MRRRGGGGTGGSRSRTGRSSGSSMGRKHGGHSGGGGGGGGGGGTAGSASMWKLELSSGGSGRSRPRGGSSETPDTAPLDPTAPVAPKPVPIIPDRFSFLTSENPPTGGSVFAFSIDDDLTYVPFFADFGPLNLGKVYRYCERVQSLLSSEEHADKHVYHFCSGHPHKRANAVFLVASFAVVCQGKSAEEAFAPFVDASPALIPFRDAAFGLCTYTLTVLDCLRGIERAIRLRFFVFDKFDIGDYENVEQLCNGDMNWLVPGKFLAFSGPLDEPKALPTGRTYTPADYVPYFKARNVTCVVRLNKPHYDARAFTAGGIRHVEMYYPDGSNPPNRILLDFIQLCEDEPGAVAVHCKAGLGRTGTCIGAYVMKHFGFTAREIIGWFRICRPGSVLGPQQQYLESIEDTMHSEGDKHRARLSSKPAGGSPGEHPVVPSAGSGAGSGLGVSAAAAAVAGGAGAGGGSHP